MALPNLTRDQAAERAALVTVDNYTIVLDLTASETTFRSTTTVEFQALPGADQAFWTPAPLLARLVAEGKTFNGKA